MCGVFLLRLAQVQIESQAVFAAMADRNHALTLIVRAPRGRILDRQGLSLAENVVQYWQSHVDNEKQLEREVTQEEAVLLMASAPASLQRVYVRTYPLGAAAAHLVGYVQNPQQAADVIFGRSGAEAQKNDALAGKDGFIRYERDAHGVPRRVLAQQEPEPGNDVRLTLDAELQRVAFAALGEQRGTVVVSLPKTGEILALVNSPSYIPGDSLPEKPPKNVAASLVDALTFPHAPLLNRAVAAAYPPGSIFKIVTALAALEHNAIDARTLVRDEGELRVGDFSYQNWYWRQFGRTEGEVTLVRALARSNDIFFYKAAEWVGPTALADTARLFGFGEKTGTVMAAEQAGIVPDPQWKQQRFGEQWYLGNTYHMGIGQGDVLVTPLQIQRFISAIATRGRLCRPRLYTDDAVSCSEVSIRPEHWQLVTQGMRDACSPGGTAFPFFTVAYDVLCKTGTAEFGAENAEGHRPTHGWFVASASKVARTEVMDAPHQSELVVTVLIESDESNPYKEGSKDAAPIAKTIIDWWMTHH